MENYEERYNKLVNFIKDLYPHTSDYVKEKLEGFFPELHENEDERDERVRKELIAWLERKQLIPTETKNEWIAWLEKQGEKKPTPKFKIGDTIHKIGENTIFPRTIEKIEDGDYVCNNSHSFVNIKFQDDYELVEQKPSWSDEDEKMLSGLISIVEDWYNSMSEKEKEYYGDCGYINWLKSIKPNN